MLETISNIVENHFSKESFRTNFFSKEDLISDIYLFIFESGKNFSDKEILKIIKDRYQAYFNIYDIEDKKSIDRFENIGGKGIAESNIVAGLNKKDVALYEFFEKIVWKDGISCPYCSSKETYPSERGLRYHNCRSCGKDFSFSINSNLRGSSKKSLESLFKVYKLLLKGTISFKDIHEETNLSKIEIEKAYLKSLPSLIGAEELVCPIDNKPKKQIVRNEIKPYEHQTFAIEKAVEFFKTGDRGKIIHPCGSGKTYTSIEIVKRLNPDNILVIVPSRLLLRQQIDNFKVNFKDYDLFVFGAMKSYLNSKEVKLLGDTVREQKRNFSKIKSSKKSIVFVTLTSFSTMEDVFPENFFDFAIFDEAHRVAGEKYKKFLKVINFKSYKKALFVTATEKNYYNDEAIGMNNPVFGDLISKVYMKEMIDANVICDYNIINIAFTSKEVENLFKENNEFFVDAKIRLPIKKRILISVLSLIKAIKEYNLKKIITYHSTVVESILFINLFKVFAKKYEIEHEGYTINSKMGKYNLESNLNNFINSEKSVISSVNSFQEGIDIPDVDAILYAYPKKSRIDIPQTVGRCVRKSTGKKLGCIIVPYTEEEKDFKQLNLILAALESIDNRVIPFKIKPEGSEFRHNIKFLDYQLKAEIVFAEKLFYTNLNLESRTKFLSYEECKAWAIENNLKTQKEYQNKLDSEKIRYFPKYPNLYYSDWISWLNFLNKDFLFLSYESSKKWAIENKITGYSDWRKRRLSYMPSVPSIYYHKEWISWYDFLDKKPKILVSYDDCKKWAKDNNIKTITEWDKHSKPKNIPSNPSKISAYKKNWTSWSDFLDNDYRRKNFLSYNEAKDWIKRNLSDEINIETRWREYKKGKYPKLKTNSKLPKYPKDYYKEEWLGWDDFLNR